MTAPVILIVEDEIKIREVLEEYFLAASFSPLCLGRGDLVLPLLKTQHVDLVLLDLMLPGMDGNTLCNKIRTFSSIPIIMLTSRVDETDILQGLEQGADDYICKPFSPKEVVARVKTVLRRSFQRSSGSLITQASFHLDLFAKEIRINDQALKITPSEFAILKAMISSPGRIFSRGELVTLIQGYDFEGYHRTIDTHIKNLRKKIGVFLPERQVIVSVYGSGYKFNPK